MQTLLLTFALVVTLVLIVVFYKESKKWEIAGDENKAYTYHNMSWFMVAVSVLFGTAFFF